MFRRLFWKIIRGIANKYFQRKIDGDKPKEPAKPSVDFDGPESEKPRFARRR